MIGTLAANTDNTFVPIHTYTVVLIETVRLSFALKNLIEH
jgi:hypothetical protein